MDPCPSLVPLLPIDLLERHNCHEPTDTRFRASARLLQSIRRDRAGHPCGHITDAAGKPRRLGSRLTPSVARAGANLIDPTLVPLVRRELAYREIGALIDTERLWGNLLASQTLMFSLFAPLKQNLALATSVFTKFLPDFVDSVTDILFEHAPDRGNLAFTGDYTAFDTLVRCKTPTGRSAFVAIEVKYTEGLGGGCIADRDRYTTLSRSAGIYRDPDSAVLRSGALEQFWRQQLLATAMVEQGLYDEGRVIVIAPAANRECQLALSSYSAELITSDPAKSAFQAITLEGLVACLAEAGAEQHAARLTERYLDFCPVEAALTASFMAA